MASPAEPMADQSLFTAERQAEVLVGTADRHIRKAGPERTKGRFCELGGRVANLEGTKD